MVDQKRHFLNTSTKIKSFILYLAEQQSFNSTDKTSFTVFAQQQSLAC